MNTNIKVVTFDLDNTLWDVDPVIQHAENEMFDYIKTHYPALLKAFDRKQFWQLRSSIIEQQPDMKHRLSQLRVEVLTQAFHAQGLTEKEAHQIALDAFSVFFHARHNVSLYESVEQTLEQLQQWYTLGALSNGNTNIVKIGLHSYFSFAYSAELVGQAKPHSLMFDKVLQRTGLLPEQIVHIGDHHEDDIMGAGALGIKTIWFNNKGAVWNHQGIEPDAKVSHWDELVETIAGF